MGSSKKKWCGKTANKNHEIFGEYPIIKKATEPSNIIWENYSVSASERMWKRALGYSLFAIMMIILYGLAYYYC
jgi:hypothetical protein